MKYSVSAYTHPPHGIRPNLGLSSAKHDSLGCGCSRRSLFAFVVARQGYKQRMLSQNLSTSQRGTLSFGFNGTMSGHSALSTRFLGLPAVGFPHSCLASDCFSQRSTPLFSITHSTKVRVRNDIPLIFMILISECGEGASRWTSFNLLNGHVHQQRMC